MTTLFLDTEFNGFGGQLISMALYTEDADNLFYEIIDLPYASSWCDPWVRQHVVPVFGKEPIKGGRVAFNRALRKYLGEIATNGLITVVADWPADIEHFFASLMIEGHWEVDWPIHAAMSKSGILKSEIPHNAMADAVALFNDYYDALTYDDPAPAKCPPIFDKSVAELASIAAKLSRL